MPNLSIVCGLILILIGLVGYLNNPVSYTALIPTAIGALLAVLGILSRMNEALRKHLMHAAVVIALLGFIATAARLLPRLGEFSGSAAQLSQLSTAIVCLAFVIFAVRSFITARRS